MRTTGVSSPIRPRTFVEAAGGCSPPRTGRARSIVPPAGRRRFPGKRSSRRTSDEASRRSTRRSHDTRTPRTSPPSSPTPPHRWRTVVRRDPVRRWPGSSGSRSARLVERMERAPETCIAAHDAAVEEDRLRRSATSRRGTRGVARLLGREAAPELPLWRDDGDGRRPVLVGEPIDPETCRPRALLATALARLAGCDLFVHGLGGEIYDVVMESWVERWLGPEVASGLAPATTATATCLLPIANDLPAADPGTTPEGLHRLESDPDLGRSGSRLRARLLAEIDAAPRRSAARRAAFLRLRAEIEDARVRGADVIEAYRGRLDRESEGRRHRAVAEDRTWPFPLHPPASLDDLLRRCRTAFAPADDEAQASPNGRGR